MLTIRIVSRGVRMLLVMVGTLIAVGVASAEQGGEADATPTPWRLRLYLSNVKPDPTEGTRCVVSLERLDNDEPAEVICGLTVHQFRLPDRTDVPPRPPTRPTTASSSPADPLLAKILDLPQVYLEIEGPFPPDYSPFMGTAKGITWVPTKVATGKVAFAERHLASTLFAPGRNTIRAVLVYRGQTIATSNSITVEGGAEDKMPAEKEFKENSKGTSREFKGDIQNIR